MDGWFSERCVYVTPIILDLLLNTNQKSCCKGKWYVRRFDPDTVPNGHIYSSIKEEEVFIYWTYFFIFYGTDRQRQTDSEYIIRVFRSVGHALNSTFNPRFAYKLQRKSPWDSSTIEITTRDKYFLDNAFS